MNTSRKFAFLAVALGCCASLASCRGDGLSGAADGAASEPAVPIDRQSGAEPSSREDRDAVARALGRLHSLNRDVSDAARFAGERTADARVRELAHHLTFDHDGDDRRLTALARERGIRLAAPDAGRTERTRSGDLSAGTLDRAFLRDIAKDHGTALDVIHVLGSARGVDPSMRDYVSGTLTMLQAHQKEARRLLDALDAGAERHEVRGDESPVATPGRR